MTKLDKTYLIQNMGVGFLILGYFGLPYGTFTLGAILGFGALVYRWSVLHVKPEILNISIWKPVGFLLFFVICLYISAMHGTDATKSMEAVQSQIHWWRPGLFLALLFNPRKGYYQAVCVAFTVGLAYILKGIGQGFNPGDHRMYGGYENANLFAAYIELLLPWVILGFMKYIHTTYLKWLGAFIVLTGVAAIVMSGSRGAVIAIFLTLILGGILHRGNKKILLGGLAVLILAGSIFALDSNVLLRSFRTNTETMDQGSYQAVCQNESGRMYVWRGSWNMIKDYPLYGVGLYNFNANYKDHYMPEGAFEPDLEHAHNTILQRLAETGIIGSIGFWLLIIYQGVYLFRHRSIDLNKGIVLAAMASMSLGLIHGMVDYFFCLALYGRIFWMQWAVAYCCSQVEINKKDRGDSNCNKLGNSDV